MTDKVRHSFVWKILQQYSSYFVKIAVQTILARLLEPGEFGMIAIVMAVINIADIIAISGLGTALVQKQDTDQEDYSTVFVVSMCFSGILYVTLFSVAPLLAEYYKMPGLTRVFRIQGVMVFIQSFASIQNAYILKNFELKKSFFATAISLTAAGLLAVLAAFYGLGVWALVILNIVTGLLSVAILYIIVPWRPRFIFVKCRFIKLFSFSWKVLCSSLFGSLLENIYNLSIGKLYGESTLGYYSRGNSYASAVIGQTTSAVGSVFLPVYSKIQDDKERLLLTMRKMTHLITFVMFPVAVGFFVVSDAFVLTFLTDKWSGCVFFLRLECFFYMALVLSAAIGQGIVALGRSDIGLKVETAKLVATILAVLFFHNYGVQFLCVVRVALAICGIAFSVIISKRMVGYGTISLLQDIRKPLLLSLIMGVVVWQISYVPFTSLIVLTLQCVAGVLIYGIGAYVWMREDIDSIISLFY